MAFISCVKGASRAASTKPEKSTTNASRGTAFVALRPGSRGICRPGPFRPSLVMPEREGYDHDSAVCASKWRASRVRSSNGHRGGLLRQGQRGEIQRVEKHGDVGESRRLGFVFEVLMAHPRGQPASGRRMFHQVLHGSCCGGLRARRGASHAPTASPRLRSAATDIGGTFSGLPFIKLPPSRALPAGAARSARPGVAARCAT